MDSEKNEAVKSINAQELLAALETLTDSGAALPLRVTGSSMLPFLAGGRDTVMLKKPKLPLKKGDIALFCRADGSLVLHRVKRLDESGYCFVGDRQTQLERGIKPQQLVGVAVSAVRKGKSLTRRSFTWFFFEKIWINMVRLRPAAMRLYGKLKGKA